MKKRIILTVFTVFCIVFSMFIGGCSAQKEKHESKNQIEDKKTLKNDCNLNEKSIETVLNRFYKDGNHKIETIEKTKEEDGWNYYTITDTEGKKYYLDSNKKGYFGTFLNETDYKNAEKISKDLNILWNRNLLYSAVTLHECNIGLITQVKKLSDFQIEVIDEEDNYYKVTMGKDGRVSKVEFGDEVLYEELPE